MTILGLTQIEWKISSNLQELLCKVNLQGTHKIQLTRWLEKDIWMLRPGIWREVEFRVNRTENLLLPKMSKRRKDLHHSQDLFLTQRLKKTSGSTKYQTSGNSSTSITSETINCNISSIKTWSSIQAKCHFEWEQEESIEKCHEYGSLKLHELNNQVCEGWWSSKQRIRSILSNWKGFSN